MLYKYKTWGLVQNILIRIVILSFAFLIVSAVQEHVPVKSPHSTPSPVTADSSDVRTSVPFLYSSPFISHSQNQKDCQPEDNIKTGRQMPVFIPDSSLTESMPILISPPVDEKMIIPFNQYSKNHCR